MNFLRRRFSSGDLQGELRDENSSILTFKKGPSPSAPSSPSKTLNAAQGLPRPVQNNKPAYNKDRCKILLVIDDQHTDWWVFIMFLFKYFTVANPEGGFWVWTPFGCGNFYFLTTWNNIMCKKIVKMIIANRGPWASSGSLPLCIPDEVGFMTLTYQPSSLCLSLGLPCFTSFLAYPCSLCFQKLCHQKTVEHVVSGINSVTLGYSG